MPSSHQRQHAWIEINLLFARRAAPEDAHACLEDTRACLEDTRACLKDTRACLEDTQACLEDAHVQARQNFGRNPGTFKKSAAKIAPDPASSSNFMIHFK